jgi:hypothetical protein
VKLLTTTPCTDLKKVLQNYLCGRRSSGSLLWCGGFLRGGLLRCCLLCWCCLASCLGDAPRLGLSEDGWLVNYSGCLLGLLAAYRQSSEKDLTAVVAFFAAGFLALGAAVFLGTAAFLAFGSAVFFGAAAFLVVVAFLVAVAGFLALVAAGFLAGADLAAGLAAAGLGSFLASLVPPDDPIITG